MGGKEGKRWELGGKGLTNGDFLGGRDRKVALRIGAGVLFVVGEEGVLGFCGHVGVGSAGFDYGEIEMELRYG